MEERDNKLGLIRNRRTAVVSLVLTGFIAAMTFRAVFSHSSHPSGWLIPLDSLLPAWAARAVNVAFFVYLLWVCIEFFRGALGQERILVAGWFLGILLSPIQNLVLPSTAAAIQYVKAASIAVAFVAAVLILLERSTPRQRSADSGVPE
jgi:hypothetical protein